MLATKVFRSTQPLRSNVRRYASPPGPASAGNSNTAIYGLLAGAGLLGAGYYYYRATEPPKPEAHAPASTDERKTVPSSLSPSASAPQKAFSGGDQGFIGLKLESVEELNHNTKKFRFALPDSEAVSGLSIASALLTRYKGPEMEKPVIRPYTPVSDEDAKGYIDFVVKRYNNGPMSEHLHSMKPEQRLDFKGPIPKYPWEPNKHDHIALIAGGTGITPMYQLIRAIFKNPSDKTKVTLVFGNLTEPDILLKPELQELENTYPNRFRAFYVLDHPPAEGWTQGRGRITKELLKTVLPEPGAKGEGEGEGEGGKDVKIFVCGPPGLYKAVSGNKTSPVDQGELTGMLKELGYEKEQVYKF